MLTQWVVHCRIAVDLHQEDEHNDEHDGGVEIRDVERSSQAADERVRSWKKTREKTLKELWSCSCPSIQKMMGFFTGKISTSGTAQLEVQETKNEYKCKNKVNASVPANTHTKMLGCHQNLHGKLHGCFFLLLPNCNQTLQFWNCCHSGGNLYEPKSQGILHNGDTSLSLWDCLTFLPVLSLWKRRSQRILRLFFWFRIVRHNFFPRKRVSFMDDTKMCFIASKVMSEERFLYDLSFWRQATSRKSLWW